MILGLARPQWRKVIRHERFLARDIILVMDLSYSMETAWNKTDGPRKIDVAKKAAIRFIQKRENDRIGLLVFGDETFGSWPLTRDLGLVSKKVDRLGSVFYGGTNLGKPLVKVIDHFWEMGQSENRILVFLSDGEAAIESGVRDRIVQEVNNMGIHFYLLGIDLRREDNDLLEIVDRTGGRFIATESSGELTAAFDEIDQLEPSMIEIEVEGESQELYPLVVLSALGLMFALILLRNTVFIELC
jgi:Ca-activated chloride channel family protein